MKIIFADTYYFLPVGNAADQGHASAAKYAASFTGRIVTTEWVLTEVGDALAAPAQRPRFLNLLQLIEADDSWTVVPATHELFKRGASLFDQRADKSWSLTDCISFVVMDQQEIVEALTADHHFEQAGFTALLT